MNIIWNIIAIILISILGIGVLVILFAAVLVAIDQKGCENERIKKDFTSIQAVKEDTGT